MSLTINKHTQMNKETVATIFGGCVGFLEAIFHNQIISGLLLAAAAGAASWAGQALLKFVWTKFYNWFKSLKK